MVSLSTEELEHRRTGKLPNISFLFSFIISQGTKKKQLQNETDIKNANMFKWYNDYTRRNYIK